MGMRKGLLLRGYLAVSGLLSLVARRILQKRRTKGKEHPTRWVEKLGQALAPRPEGPLIWINAVGLGEVLSLRGLITQLHAKRPDLSILVTSTTAPSATVFAENLPPNTIHQFLPVDVPTPRRKFLDHFQPDLCVWAEQDIWPGFVTDLAKRNVPQCIIASRMNEQSFQAHKKAKGLYRDLYQAMDLITAQDEKTSTHLIALGAKNPRLTGSLKPAAPVLRYGPQAYEKLSAKIKGRRVWAIASAHLADKDIVLEAHQLLLKDDPNALLIVVPRFPKDGSEFSSSAPRRSLDKDPQDDDPVWICDTFGDLGLIYRLTKTVLIGGTFDDTEGHNPWEAAASGATILHGPNTANFAADFTLLDQAQAAIEVSNATELYEALQHDDLLKIAQNATACIDAAADKVDALATDLLALLER